MGRELGLGPSRLRERWRSTFGRAPMDDLLALRLDRARLLLADGLTVAAAARRSGFNDLSYFHRRFRRHFGSTPGAGRSG